MARNCRVPRVSAGYNLNTIARCNSGLLLCNGGYGLIATRYYGGKSHYLAGEILKYFPPHKIYCEPFGGAAGLLLNKPASPTEIYNDLSKSLVNFFRVVRDRTKLDVLLELLDVTPYARDEYYECLEVYRNVVKWQSLTDIEQARVVLVILNSSMFATFKGDGWAFGGPKNHCTVQNRLYNKLPILPKVAARLRDVQIENFDALDLITRWDSVDTLFYLDPPYVEDSRKSNGNYEYEQDVNFHTQLLDQINGIKGMAVLSGYESKLYNEKLTGWKRIEIKSRANRSNYVEETPRTECLWLNGAAAGKVFKPVEESIQPSMF